MFPALQKGWRGVGSGGVSRGACRWLSSGVSCVPWPAHSSVLAAGQGQLPLWAGVWQALGMLRVRVGVPGGEQLPEGLGGVGRETTMA